MKVVIIGGGTAGLLLAIGLRKKNIPVTLIYQIVRSEENSALICPQLVMDFLEKLAPGIVPRLQNSGARKVSHKELLFEKFRSKNLPPVEDLSFLFLSRKLLTEELSLTARNLGVKFVHDEITSFVTSDTRVEMMKGQADNYTGDFFFDCTGSVSARRNWFGSRMSAEKVHFAGPGEEVFQRLYKSETESHLVLRSLDGARGGIYPVESNHFFLTLSCPEGTSGEDIEYIADAFLNITGSRDFVSKALPLDQWRQLTKKSYKSDFYESTGSGLQNYFPIGEGVLSSLPVYGRGISLVILQLSSLLETVSASSDAEDIQTAITEGFRAAEEKWSEIKGENLLFPKRQIRKWAHGLLEREPKAYECFLAFYQLRLSPIELFLGLLKARFLKTE